MMSRSPSVRLFGIVSRRQHTKGMCMRALNPVTFSITAEVAHDALATVS